MDDSITSRVKALERVIEEVGEICRLVEQSLEGTLDEAEEQPYKRYWLLIIWDGIQPELQGPWPWEELIMQARAVKHLEGDDHGLFHLSASEEGPKVGAFASATFEDKH